MNSKPFVLAALLSLTLVLGGCDRIKSVIRGGGDGGSSSIGGGSASDGALSMLNGFEGEIDIQTSSKKGEAPMNIPLLVKSGKLRANLPTSLASHGMNGYGIVNPAEKKLYFVQDDKKQAILIDLNTAGDQMKAMSGGGMPHGGGSAPPPNPPKVTKTGQKDKVAGYTCEVWRIDEANVKKGEVCVADQGASWFSLPITGIPTEHAWMLELMDGKHFPLRFVGYENGVESGRIEVTKIDKRTLAASQFEVPPGYAVVDMAQMFQQLQQGHGMPHR